MAEASKVIETGTLEEVLKTQPMLLEQIKTSYSPEAYRAYVSVFDEEVRDGNAGLEHFEDVYRGEHDTKTDFVKDQLEGCEDTYNALPDYIKGHIDYDGVWSHTFIFQFVEQDGFYFEKEC